MNERHLIWIVPVLLVVGFAIGFVSGFRIPKEITFAVAPDTLQVFNKSLDVVANKSMEPGNNLDLCARRCVYLTTENRTDIYQCAQVPSLILQTEK